LLGEVTYRELRTYRYFGGRSDVNSFANLRLESWFLDAKRIASHRQAGETVFAGHACKNATFQSSALADNRDADSWDNGATWVGDGAGNGSKLALRPRTG
jgi:hypothetical protein